MCTKEALLLTTLASLSLNGTFSDQFEEFMQQSHQQMEAMRQNFNNMNQHIKQSMHQLWQPYSSQGKKLTIDESRDLLQNTCITITNLFDSGTDKEPTINAE